MNCNDTGDLKVLSQKKKRSQHDECENPVLVQHCYHDRAEEPPSPFSNISFPQEAKASFPLKLYRALSRLEEDGHSHLMSWQPHGRCFVIQHPLQVVRLRQFLPNYFDGISKITSFQRQLNLYGFKRITQGLDKGGYYHEYFLRGKPHLVNNIHRIKVKGTRVRGKPNPDQEPDFWSMPWLVGGDRSDSLADAPVNQGNHELTTEEKAQELSTEEKVHQLQEADAIMTNEKVRKVASFTQPCVDAFDYDACKTDAGAAPATNTTSLGFICSGKSFFQSPTHHLYPMPLIPQEQQCYQHKKPFASSIMTNLCHAHEWDTRSVGTTAKQAQENHELLLPGVQAPTLEDWLLGVGLDDPNAFLSDSEQAYKNNSDLSLMLQYNDPLLCLLEEARASDS